MGSLTFELILTLSAALRLHGNGLSKPDLLYCKGIAHLFVPGGKSTGVQEVPSAGTRPRWPNGPPVEGYIASTDDRTARSLPSTAVNPLH